MKDNSGPAHTIRAGRVLARIYRNHDAQRGDWYSVSVVRVFKGSDG